MFTLATAESHLGRGNVHLNSHPIIKLNLEMPINMVYIVHS